MSELKHILPGEPIPKGSLFHQRRYHVALKSSVLSKRGGVLLDIGCGNASQTEYFANHFQRTIGVDLQYDRLKSFRDDLRKREINQIVLIGGNSEDLPFKNEMFDFVTCFEVLEHVRDEQKTITEIKRVLKEGGTLIMSVPHRWWIFETHGADLPFLPWNRVPFFSWLPQKIHDHWARARIYTRKDIKGILENAGFKNISLELLTAPMDVVKNKKLQEWLRKLVFNRDTTKLPFLASNIFIHAKKSA